MRNLISQILKATVSFMLAFMFMGAIGDIRKAVTTDNTGDVISTPITFSNQVSMVIPPTNANDIVRYSDLTNFVGTNSGGQVFTNKNNVYSYSSSNTFNALTTFSNTTFKTHANMGGNRATNAGDAVNLQDYVTLNQLISTNGAANAAALTNRGNAFLGTITNQFFGYTILSNTLMQSILNMGGNNITNLFAGVNGLDAVNVTQLNAITNGIAGLSVSTNSQTALNSITNLQNMTGASGSVPTATNLNARSWGHIPLLANADGTIAITNLSGTNLVLNVPIQTNGLASKTYVDNATNNAVAACVNTNSQVALNSITNLINVTGRSGSIPTGTNFNSESWGFIPLFAGNSSIAITNFSGTNIGLYVSVAASTGAAALTNSDNTFLGTNTNTFNGYTALSNTLIQSVLNMGGYNITNLAAAVNGKDAVNLTQLQNATNATWSPAQYPLAVTNLINVTGASGSLPTGTNFNSRYWGFIPLLAGDSTIAITNLSGTNLSINVPIQTNGLAAKAYVDNATNGAVAACVSTNSQTALNSITNLANQVGASGSLPTGTNINARWWNFIPLLANADATVAITNLSGTNLVINVPIQTNGLAAKLYVDNATNNAVAACVSTNSQTALNSITNLQNQVGASGSIPTATNYNSRSWGHIPLLANADGTVAITNLSGTNIVINAPIQTNGLAAKAYVDNATNGAVGACVNTNSQTALNSITNLQNATGAAGSVRYATNLNARSWQFPPFLAGNGNVAITNLGDTNIVFYTLNTGGGGGTKLLLHTNLTADITAPSSGGTNLWKYLTTSGSNTMVTVRGAVAMQNNGPMAITVFCDGSYTETVAQVQGSSNYQIMPFHGSFLITSNVNVYVVAYCYGANTIAKNGVNNSVTWTNSTWADFIEQ